MGTLSFDRVFWPSPDAVDSHKCPCCQELNKTQETGHVIITWFDGKENLFDQGNGWRVMMSSFQEDIVVGNPQPWLG
jgi:hypothetical protein